MLKRAAMKNLCEKMRGRMCAGAIRGVERVRHQRNCRFEGLPAAFHSKFSVVYFLDCRDNERKRMRVCAEDFRP